MQKQNKKNLEKGLETKATSSRSSHKPSKKYKKSLAFSPEQVDIIKKITLEEASRVVENVKNRLSAEINSQLSLAFRDMRQEQIKQQVQREEKGISLDTIEDILSFMKGKDLSGNRSSTLVVSKMENSEGKRYIVNVSGELNSKEIREAMLEWLPFLK